MMPPQQADPRPRGDVSPAVGLVGLGGLLAWILLCRNWPVVADILALPGPRLPLSGPHAALAGVLASALPMALWSIVVDKVHRRASTGIDWDSPRPLGAVVDVSITKLAGLWATWAVIGFFYCVARWYWQGSYLFSMKVIGFAAVPMFVLSVPYVLWLDRRLVQPRDGAWHFGALLIGREACDMAEVWAHARGWAVKGFFTAFMISILPSGFAAIVTADLAGLAANPVRASVLLTELLFVIDVQIGTAGYLFTFKPLDAQIRSANPYLAGWLAALLCYPPFVLMAPGNVLSYQANTADWAYWFAGNAPLLWAWGAVLVGLTGIYAWATFAFGIRFSNLTYRGVITSGPYRFTRHPAYLAKNAYWWCSTLPFLVTSHSLTDAVRNTCFLALTSAVYYWRARTEEQHLLAEDAHYRAYHAWMARNAPITRTLRRLGAAMRPRVAPLLPAE